MKIECPKCSCSITLGSDHIPAGKAVACPKCKARVTIPAPAAAAGAGKPPAKPPTVKFSCPDCGNSLRLPADFPVGKKAKCPICDRIFEPRAAPAARPGSTPVTAVGSGLRPASAPSIPSAPKRDEAPADAPESAAPGAPPADDGCGPATTGGDDAQSPVPTYTPSSSTFTTGSGSLVTLLPISAGVIVLFLIVWAFYSLYLSGPSRPAQRRVYSAEGEVVHEGKPAVGAVVTLIPEEAGSDFFRPTGTTGPDGRFSLTTYFKEDGAPAGRYKVGIFWGGPGSTSPFGSAASAPNPNQPPGLDAKKPILPWEAMKEAAAKEKGKKRKKGEPQPPLLDLEKYANPETSGFVVEIKATSNKLTPFELK